MLLARPVSSSVYHRAPVENYSSRHCHLGLVHLTEPALHSHAVERSCGSLSVSLHPPRKRLVQCSPSIFERTAGTWERCERNLRYSCFHYGSHDQYLLLLGQWIVLFYSLSATLSLAVRETPDLLCWTAGYLLGRTISRMIDLRQHQHLFLIILPKHQRTKQDDTKSTPEELYRI